MLFIDKYIVNGIDDVMFGRDTYEMIGKLAKIDNMPHLIVMGNQGIGKKNLINYYIRTKYNLTQIKTNLKVIKIACSNKTINFGFTYSNYHYLIDPSNHGVYDKQIIQHILNEILKYRPITHVKYHMIVVNNAHRLTVEAQQSLRRTLEKYVYNCRFIFIIDGNTSMIDPIKSRCLLIKLSSPTKAESVSVLRKICDNENIDASDNSLYKITERSQNLRENISLLQLLHTQKLDLRNASEVSKHMTIDDNCDRIASMLLKNITVDIDVSEFIRNLRELIQLMLVECLDTISIVKSIFFILYRHLTLSDLPNRELICVSMIKITNDCIYGLKNCNKPIYYIEGFCLQVYQVFCTLASKGIHAASSVAPSVAPSAAPSVAPSVVSLSK